MRVAWGPVLSATDDVFSATGHVFEATGQRAAPECPKCERAGCFWIPCGEPFWSKSARGCPKGSKSSEKAIPKSMQKMVPEKDIKCIPNPSKIMPKRIPNSSICYAFVKKAEMLQTVCFPIENVVLAIQQLRKTNQK